MPSSILRRSAERVSLHEWHVIQLFRTGRSGMLRVDGGELVEGVSSGAFTQLTLLLDLFIGGHRNYDEVARAAHVNQSFRGCIQKVCTREGKYRTRIVNIEQGR